MTTTRDANRHPAMPGWFILLARLLPVGLLTQFLSAGLGLFHDGTFLGLHGAVGFTLSLPLLGLVAGVLLVPRLRGFRWWAALLLALYCLQIALAARSVPLAISFHPANGALLLTASLALLARVEGHNRSRPAISA